MEQVFCVPDMPKSGPQLQHSVLSSPKYVQLDQARSGGEVHDQLLDYYIV